MNNPNPLITFSDCQIYQEEEEVLSEINIEIMEGEFIFIIGRTGSGKSSFLRSIYADVPVLKGVCNVEGLDLKNIEFEEIPYLRRKLGIVFQDFQLLTDRTAYHNLKFVLQATGWKNKSDIDNRIYEVLDQVGLKNKSEKMPHQLSGGEQQRLGIARALLNNPSIIIADEPTGNLDPEVSHDIIKLFYEINTQGTTIVMATHDISLIGNHEGRIFKCEQGKILPFSRLRL